MSAEIERETIERETIERETIERETIERETVERETIERETIERADVRVTDAVLARRAAGRIDREAEAELCRRFAPRLRLYGLKHLRDEDRARDLVQAVLQAVIEALRAGRVEDVERIDRFMLGTARHMSAKFRQRDGRARPMAPHELSELPELEGILSAEGVLSAHEARLDIDSLLRCISKLEMRARTVLHLAFCRDKAADEIAAVLEMTAGNVRVVRCRAIAQLRDCLAATEIA